jgi:hypothetical protein
LPNTLAAISDGAFEGCSSLKEIALPGTLHPIVGWAGAVAVVDAAGCGGCGRCGAVPAVVGEVLCNGVDGAAGVRTSCCDGGRGGAGGEQVRWCRTVQCRSIFGC